eukprot:gene14479-30824_t
MRCFIDVGAIEVGSTPPAVAMATRAVAVAFSLAPYPSPGSFFQNFYNPRKRQGRSLACALLKALAMTHSLSFNRRQLLATAAAAAALTAGAGAFAQSGQRVLRVGHQKGWLSILKGRGTLEKRLAPLGVKVTWTEFNAGPVQLEALNVGSIDFGDVGEAPPIFAQAAGAPLVYAGATVPRPALEAVVVPKDSPIRSVADLKGKRVAYNKGSNGQYFLVKLLEKHGLQYSDVQPIFLPPADARAAFEKGAVDAWVIWDPFLAAVELQTGARVLADARGGYVDVDRSTTLDWDALRGRIAAHGMRNSNCVAIAPTATISNIIGVDACIEPCFGNLSVKSNLSGEFTVINSYLVRDLKALGLWDDVMVMDLKHFDGSLSPIDRVPQEIKQLYATAFEVETRWLVEAAARRQKWIDQAQSLNIYMAGASGKKLDETYKLAWLRGLKTTYYLRTMSATHVEKSTVAAGRMNAVSSGNDAQGSTKMSSALEAAAAAAQAQMELSSNAATDIKFCGVDDPTCESCQ